MTHALVLFAHPCSESFSAALRYQVVQTLQNRGWSVDDCDLYKERFDPLLSVEERRNYHDPSSTARETIRPYVNRLLRAEALIFVFPVWNFGFPAILKGFLDRVFLPDVSFKLVDGKVQPALTHIQSLAAVTTYGGTRLRAIGVGDPPRKCFTSAIKHVTRPKKMRYLALYDMNRTSEVRRHHFLNRVSREMEML